MIIDPLRLALVISPAEVDDDDGAVLLSAALVPLPAAVPLPAEVDNDDGAGLIGVGVTGFKGVDVMIDGSEAGAAVDVGVLGAEDPDGVVAGGAAAVVGVAGGAGAGVAPPPLASATIIYCATLSLGPGLTIITIPAVQCGDEKT